MNNYPHIKIKCGLNSLGTLEDLNLMGVYEREKGTREIEGWRGRPKTLQRMKEGLNQAVKERQRAVVIEKYKNGTKKGESGEKRD